MNPSSVVGIVAVTLGLIGVAVLVLSLALTGPDWVTAAAVALLFGNVGVLAVTAGAPTFAPVLPYLLLVLPAVFQVGINRSPIAWGWPMAAMLAFALVAALSTVFSPRPGDSFPTLVQWLLEGLVFFLALTNSIRSLGALRRCIQAMVLTGALVGLFVAYQKHQGDFYNTHFGLAQVSDPYDITASAPSVLDDGTVEGEFRAAGMIGEPNFFAMIMTALTPWAAYLVATARKLVSRLGWAVAGLLVVNAVFLSYSRGALIAAAGVLVVMALWGVIPRRSLAYLAMGAAAAVMAVPSLAERLATLGNVVSGGVGGEVSTAGRMSEVTAAWQVFAAHPIVGVGPGQFPLYYQRYANARGESVHSGDGARNAHNIVLGLAADVGVLGLLSFVFLVVVVVVGLARIRRDPRLRALVAAGLMSVALYVACSAFLHLAYARYLWLYLALPAALIALASEQRPVPADGSLPADASDLERSAR